MNIKAGMIMPPLVFIKEMKIDLTLAVSPLVKIPLLEFMSEKNLSYTRGFATRENNSFGVHE